MIGISVPIETAATPPGRLADRAKILLVDDTPGNLVSLEAALDGQGADHVMAQSGMEALRDLLEDDFAAVLRPGQSRQPAVVVRQSLRRAAHNARHIHIAHKKTWSGI